MFKPCFTAVILGIIDFLPHFYGVNHILMLATISSRMKIIRQFDVYDKYSDELKDEIVIKELDIEIVKGLVKLIDGDSKLYFAYKVEGDLQKYFENLGYSFEMEKFDYDLACYQDN